MSHLRSTRTLSLAAACAGLFSSAPLRAQLTPGTQLDPVLVTATGTPQALSDTIAHSTVLTREDIERSQAVDLPALLAREAGVQFSRSGGRGAATTLFLRGAPSSQVLLLVDGVPQTRQDASGAISIEHLMLDQIERVEVVRGNVSAIYGSGAIGGVIQVFTRRGKGEPGGDLALEGGSYGYWRAAANAGGQWGATRFAVGLSAQQSQGFSAQDANANPAVNPDDDGYRNLSGTLSLTHAVADGHTLGASYTQSDGKLDYDSAFATAVDAQTSRTILSNAKLWSSNRISERWQSELSLGWQRDDSRFVESGAFGFESQYTTTTGIANWSNRVQVSPDWKLTGGVELQRQGIATDDGFGGQFDRSRRVAALLAGALGQWDAVSLQANVRYDDIEGIGGQPTGYLGVGIQLAPQWKLTASASTAFNAPPLGYLYAPFFGNPALQAEEARSAELGLQYAADGQLLRATGFASRVRNEFQYDFATSVFQNLARTDNQGLELSYSAIFAQTELAASLTLQDPTDAATGNRLLRRAGTLASASVWQTFGALRVGAQWAYVGSRPDVGDVTLPSYSLVDLLAQWNLGHGLQLFGRIENLFDAQYQTVAGYPQASLGAFIGLRWRL